MYILQHKLNLIYFRIIPYLIKYYHYYTKKKDHLKQISFQRLQIKNCYCLNSYKLSQKYYFNNFTTL